jgi:hypothetical protein
MMLIGCMNQIVVDLLMIMKEKVSNDATKWRFFNAI